MPVAVSQQKLNAQLQTNNEGERRRVRAHLRLRKQEKKSPAERYGLQVHNWQKSPTVGGANGEIKSSLDEGESIGADTHVDTQAQPKSRPPGR